MTALAQNMVALEHANEIRLARAGVKRRVRAGELTFAAALHEPSVQSMTVYALLVCQHRYGRQRALDVLRHADTYPISESKTIASLSQRQRDALTFWMAS